MRVEKSEEKRLIILCSTEENHMGNWNLQDRGL
jgi:hypothetical protein